MHWDDLRVVRAIYQIGSFAGAAARLGINETTVARRLARLENDLGGKLFEARDGARHPTAKCQEVMARVEAMAAEAARIEEPEDAGVEAGPGGDDRLDRGQGSGTAGAGSARRASRA